MYKVILKIVHLRFWCNGAKKDTQFLVVILLGGKCKTDQCGLLEVGVKTFGFSSMLLLVVDLKKNRK